MASMFLTQGAMHRSVNQRGVYMLELIEIVRHGLPLSELRTWLFFAAFAASGIAAGTASMSSSTSKTSRRRNK